jgi:cell division protein FtsZ
MDGIQGVCRLLTRNGLIKVDFADLCAVTRGRHVESSFASAQAAGASRAADLAEKILGHPLLEEGLVLAEARSVLVSLQGGPDLTMSEVQCVMDRLNRHCGPASVTFGAVIDPAFEGRLAMTVIASRGSDEEAQEQREAPSPGRQAGSPLAPGAELFGTPSAARPPSRYVPPAPEFSHEQKERMYSLQSGGPRKKGFRSPRQTQLQLDIVPRSRFAKSEPTIHEGEDLDIPTYIRRGLSLN